MTLESLRASVSGQLVKMNECMSAFLWPHTALIKQEKVCTQKKQIYHSDMAKQREEVFYKSNSQEK